MFTKSVHINYFIIIIITMIIIIITIMIIIVIIELTKGKAPDNNKMELN